MEEIEWMRLIEKTLSVPLFRGMTCWSGQYSSPYAGGLEGVSLRGFHSISSKIAIAKKSYKILARPPFLEIILHDVQAIICVYQCQSV